jgi:hypothetical protein
MVQREGTLLIVFLIVFIALFLLATGGFFFEYQKLEETRRRLRGTQDNLDRETKAKTDLQESVKSLRTLIAGANRVNDFPRVEDIRSRELKDAENAVNEALKHLGIKTTEFDSLLQPYARYQEIFKAYRDSLDTQVKEREGNSKTYMTSLTGKDQAIADLKTQLEAKITEQTQTQQKWEDCENKHSTVVARMTQETSERDEQITDLRVDMRRRLAQKDNEIQSLLAANRQLQKEKFQDRNWDQDAPDGALAEVANELGKAWIDLGRKDHLMTGLIFRVYQPIKGGKKLYKGKVEVRKVEENLAEVSIVEQVDPDRIPMAPGDRIISPFYDSKKRLIFVFAGTGLRTNDMTQDFLRSKLASYGVDMASDVGITTNFVVALKDYEATKEFKVAQTLGIPVIREEELLEFIGQ